MEIVAGLFFLVLTIGAVTIGIKLERAREMKSRIKSDEKIISARDAIEADLHEINRKIASHNLGESDMGAMLSSYQDDRTQKTK